MQIDYHCAPDRSSPMECAVSFSGQIYPDDTVGYLRIASETGRHPIEPIGVGEFRIGSGSNCHLRFEESDVPEVQAILVADRDGVVLQTVSPSVSVVINGSEETECRLADGDLLELGSHRLLFRLVAVQNRITLDEESFNAAEVDAVQAEDVVDRLNEQIELVEELTHSPVEGLAELMKSVANFGDTVVAQQESDETVSELEQVKSLLLKHHEASRIRLESLTEVLDNVVRQQKLIADTLEVMSGRIQQLDNDGQNFPQRRHSA